MFNKLLLADSYKYSHSQQYPADTRFVSSYIEARGGANESVFFGLQAFIKEYLQTPFTQQDVSEMVELIQAHGLPVNESGFMRIVNKHGGYFPVTIQAVPEGLVMDTRNVQLQIVNSDPELPWITSFLETALLRAIWYPSSVATLSRNMKKIIANGLFITSDIPVDDQIQFKLHDFGARGASSFETAMLGGMSHLVNFMGSDTTESLIGARRFYNEPMAGFSIPASEHSTITSWGQDGEEAAYRNMIKLFSGDGRLYSCVSDSYDIYNAVKNIWGGSLKDEVIKSGGTLVVRPDSGDVLTAPVKVIEILMQQFGYTLNSKGFKVLPSYIRVIQGDGITRESLPLLISNLIKAGISIDNIAFGMGGGLLQAHTRDDLQYAMKTSAIMGADGEWRDVFKDPIEGAKKSKKGRLGLISQCGVGSCSYRTVPEAEANDQKNILERVFHNGELLKEWKFSEVRQKAALQPKEYINVNL